MRIAHSLASALLLSGSLCLPATAADLTTAPGATGYNWNGFYVGVGGGIGAIVHEVEVPPFGGFEFNGIGGEGYFGELTVGYDMQLTERIVAGVFATYRAGNIATTLDVDFGPINFDADVTLDHGYDIIGRLGYLVTPNTLAYVLGGYSHQHFALDTNIGFDMDWDADGYVLGGGLETVLTGNWTLKSEYRYGQYDLGNFGLGSFLDVDSSTHTFHAALAYRFGGGATAAASFAPVNYDFAGLKVGIAGGLGAVVHELDIFNGIANFNGIGGEGSFGEAIEDAEFQALYSHAIAPFWDLQVGVRQDVAGPDTTHAVVGVQGLAPYMFEIDAALFASHRGDITARIEAELDQRITQRLILQPRGEISLSAQDVAELGIGAGIDKVEVGLRLRYEIIREFAPYVGIEQSWRVGGSADFARLRGEDPSVTNYVVGIRFWF